MSKYGAFKLSLKNAIPYTNWLGGNELVKHSKAASDLYARILLQQRLIDSNAGIAVRQIRTKKQFKYEFVLDRPTAPDVDMCCIVAKLVTDFKDKVISRVVYDNA